MKTQTKNIKTFLWLLTLMMTLSFFSCEKDPLEDCRKDPTSEYFTCKVNGERWEPQCEGEPLFGGCTPWDVQYYRKTSGNLGMYIKNESNKQNFTFLTRNQKIKIGENKLYLDDEIQTRFSNLNLIDSCIRYKLDTFQIYSFNVTKIDTINYFLSATFHFIGKNDCGEEIHISDGEFNLPYRF
jgi:hypothetical protein